MRCLQRPGRGGTTSAFGLGDRFVCGILTVIDGHRRGFPLRYQIGSRSGAVFPKVARISIDRMSGPVQAERFLLVGQLLDLGPWRNVWKWDDGRPRVVRVAAEQIDLTEVLVPLQPVAMLAGAIDGGKEPGANEIERLARLRLRRARDQRIARTGFDERFENALVGDSKIELFAQGHEAMESGLRVVHERRGWLDIVLRRGL